MKLKVVIVSIFLVQTSASFYEFSDSFNSVKSSFDKLLNDVVSDVKVTIDCTIMAVEEALSLNGMFGDHSSYDKNCRAQSEDVITQAAVRDAREMTKDLSHHIEESVAEIDKTIESILDKRKPAKDHFYIDIKQMGDDETKEETVDKFPNNFRSVVKKIVNDDTPKNAREDKAKEEIINLIDFAIENNTEHLSAISETSKPAENNTNSSETNNSDLSLKLLKSKDAAHEQDFTETEKFIQQSQYTQMLMNSFLRANQDAAVNVFENPDLLNLG